jgi:aspartate-semialdehyde dehydrogenase
VRWLQETEIPPHAADLEVKGGADALEAEILFSAIPGGRAGPMERALAAKGHAVFTNARDLRLEKDVPLVIAEVNPDQLGMIETQRKAHGSDGFVVANGNCTAIAFALSLKPVLDAFGIERVCVVSMQALSGAGYPGVPSLDILGNVVPYIPNEEERLRLETPKFLGRFDGQLKPTTFPIGATCTRVPVTEGHTEVVTVRTERDAAPDDVAQAFASFKGAPQDLGLPSAPHRPIIVRSEPDRPQPTKDHAASGGMAAVVGRIARDEAFQGIRYVVLSSNTVRGAAGASLLNAELCAATGYLP